MAPLRFLPLLFLANTAFAQAAWPGIGGERENLMIHDACHSLTAVAVAESWRFVWRDSTDYRAYMLGTVAWPLLAETYDILRWEGGKVRNWKEHLDDIITYQGAWVVPLLRRKRYLEAAVVALGVGGFIYLRYNR